MGTRIPRSLREYLMPADVQIEYHDDLFDMAAPDDEWLPYVGKRGWIVIGHDYNYHENAPELAALKQYKVGAFYLWGSEAPRWETMRVFAKAYDTIIDIATKTPRPFVYRIFRNGSRQEVYL